MWVFIVFSVHAYLYLTSAARGLSIRKLIVLPLGVTSTRYRCRGTAISLYLPLLLNQRLQFLFLLKKSVIMCKSTSPGSQMKQGFFLSAAIYLNVAVSNQKALVTLDNVHICTLPLISLMIILNTSFFFYLYKINLCKCPLECKRKNKHEK